MKTKRLLLTCTELMAVQFLVPHIKYLSENGFSVKLACSVVGDRLDDLKAKLDGVCEIETVRLVRSPFSASNLNGFKDLKRIINSEKWDIIWTNEPVMSIMTRLAAKTARKNGTKVIYMVHGFHFYDGAPLLNWLLFYPIEKYCSRLCDMIIAINNEDFQRAKTFHSKRVEKIDGVGVNTDAFGFSEENRKELREELGVSDDEIMILNVAELTKRKNQQVVLNALKQLGNGKVRLFVCGVGDNEDYLKNLTTELGLSANVEFLGYRKDVYKIYSAADIFTLCSLHEGLPKAIMEAMANGKPVVCPNIRGCVDAVTDGKGGYVVENAPEKYAEAFKKLVGDEKFRESFGEYNREAVKTFEEDKALNNVLNLMKSVLK